MSNRPAAWLFRPKQTADLTLPPLLVRKFLGFLEPSREADQALLNSLLETIVHRPSLSHDGLDCGKE